MRLPAGRMRQQSRRSAAARDHRCGIGDQPITSGPARRDFTAARTGAVHSHCRALHMMWLLAAVCTVCAVAIGVWVRWHSLRPSRKSWLRTLDHRPCSCRLCNGAYEPVRQLGEGGFGVSFLVRRGEDQFVMKLVRVRSRSLSPGKSAAAQTCSQFAPARMALLRCRANNGR